MAENRRIFTYWVNPEGSYAPPYIQLCLQTWYENIPGLEIVIINHDNLYQWIYPQYDLRVFRKLTLPMQSDVVSYSVLRKHGGVFMDADTIVTKDIFEEIDKLDRNKLYFFGQPQQNAVHMAVMIAMEKHNSALEECVKIENGLIKKLSQNALQVSWDTFGNNVINQVMSDGSLKEYISILDRTQTGSILESNFFSDSNTYLNYLNFYFTPNNITLDDALDKIRFGLVCLHNSWTPEDYRGFDFDQILNNDLMVSKLIKHGLGDACLDET